jgi:NAD(P)H dehydrogenase (quinone)
MHGGQESTLLTMMLPLLHHGMLIVGLPYTETELFQTKTGGSPYGATRLTDDLEATPLSDEERKLCIALGKRVASTAIKLLK